MLLSACFQLLSVVLKLVDQLVELGYVAHLDTISRLVPPLTDLINGCDDKEFPNRRSSVVQAHINEV